MQQRNPVTGEWEPVTEMDLLFMKVNRLQRELERCNQGITIAFGFLGVILGILIMQVLL